MTRVVSDHDATNLNMTHHVTVSPDGKHVYATGFSASSIVHWTRNTATGALSNKVVVNDSLNLNRVVAITVSPDGKHVYALGIVLLETVWCGE